MNVVVVIPTYNERENIGGLVHGIFSVFNENNIDGGLIIVDDNSPDGTSRVVADLSAQYPITLIRRDSKQGLGSAYREGFRRALDDGFDVIFEMDADHSHDPLEIPNFIRALDQADAIIGSRYVDGGGITGWCAWRRCLSKGANIIARSFTGIDIGDITTGYRAYRRRVLEDISTDSITSEGYEFQAEILYRIKLKGFKIREIPITFGDRTKGRSKLSRKDSLNFFVLCARIFFSRLTGRGLRIA